MASCSTAARPGARLPTNADAWAARAPVEPANKSLSSVSAAFAVAAGICNFFSRAPSRAWPSLIDCNPSRLSSLSNRPLGVPSSTPPTSS